MEADLPGWLSPNRIYPGVGAALGALLRPEAQAEVYIVTTKQARFTQALLEQKAGIDFAPSRIFSQAESGAPKSEVLAALAAAHPGAGAYHFVEDKMGTLEKVRACVCACVHACGGGLRDLTSAQQGCLVHVWYS